MGLFSSGASRDENARMRNWNRVNIAKDETTKAQLKAQKTAGKYAAKADKYAKRSK